MQISFKQLVEFIALLGLIALGVTAITDRTADAATVCYIANGCIGTSTAPTYGKVLIGDANGNYEFVASSTLGAALANTIANGLTGTSTPSTSDCVYWYTGSYFGCDGNFTWNQSLLDINANGNALAMGSSNSASYATFGAARAQVGYDGSNVYMWAGSGKGAKIEVNSGNVAVIATGGSFVGIGTTTPWAALSVSTTTAPAFVVATTSTAFEVDQNGNVTTGVAGAKLNIGDGIENSGTLNFLGASGGAGLTMTTAGGSTFTANFSSSGSKTDLWENSGTGGLYYEIGGGGATSLLVGTTSTNNLGGAALFVTSLPAAPAQSLLTIASSTGLSLFAINGFGSTTASNGFNITNGCYAINNSCIGGSGGGSGTVTSIATNNGLTGGTITTTGTLGLDTSLLSTNTLTAWNGSKLAATGTPQLTIGNLLATSTTATSTVDYGLNVATAGGCLAVNSNCVSLVRPYFASSTGDAVVAIPVVAGEKVMVTAIANGSSGCQANPMTATFDWRPATYAASTTIESISSNAGNASGAPKCSASSADMEIATTTDTWYYEMNGTANIERTIVMAQKYN